MAFVQLLQCEDDVLLEYRTESNEHQKWHDWSSSNQMQVSWSFVMCLLVPFKCSCSVLPFTSHALRVVLVAICALWLLKLGVLYTVVYMVKLLH